MTCKRPRYLVPLSPQCLLMRLAVRDPGPMRSVEKYGEIKTYPWCEGGSNKGTFKQTINMHTSVGPDGMHPQLLSDLAVTARPFLIITFGR